MVRAFAVCCVIAAVSVVVAAPSPFAEVMRRGRELYEGSAAGCSACHGVTGQGNGPVAFALKPPPRNLVKDPFKAGDSVEQIYTTITKGLPGTQMAAYPHLPDGDRWALAAYVRGFRQR